MGMFSLAIPRLKGVLPHPSPCVTSSGTDRAFGAGNSCTQLSQGASQSEALVSVMSIRKSLACNTHMNSARRFIPQGTDFSSCIEYSFSQHWSPSVICCHSVPRCRAGGAGSSQASCRQGSHQGCAQLERLLHHGAEELCSGHTATEQQMMTTLGIGCAARFNLRGPQLKYWCDQ